MTKNIPKKPLEQTRGQGYFVVIEWDIWYNLNVVESDKSRNLKGKIDMAKKTKIVVGCIVFLSIACGLIWWFMPVHFLREVEPKEAAIIVVFNGNNGDEFEVTNPGDISYIANTIKQITLRRDSFKSGVDYYYILTFINENGEEMDSFGIQNPYIMRRDDAFYRCNGELGTVVEYLDNLEAAQFPDYKKDPDFPYS